MPRYLVSRSHKPSLFGEERIASSSVAFYYQHLCTREERMAVGTQKKSCCLACSRACWCPHNLIISRGAWLTVAQPKHTGERLARVVEIREIFSAIRSLRFLCHKFLRISTDYKRRATRLKIKQASGLWCHSADWLRIINWIFSPLHPPELIVSANKSRNRKTWIIYSSGRLIVVFELEKS